MIADGSARISESHEEEIEALAVAMVEPRSDAVARAGSSLLLKIVTGSPSGHGVVGMAASVFGQWLANNPDARLMEEARAFQAAENDKTLEKFADLLQPQIELGLRSVAMSLAPFDSEPQHPVEANIRRAHDLEALLGHALRTMSPLQSELEELGTLIRQALEVCERSRAPVQSSDGAVEPRFPGAAADSAEIDFFVSHTSADASWAEWIAWVIEAEGYRVKLQKWDFRPGSNFVLEMHDAAMQAARTIAVLSSAYFESPFGRAEWAAAFQADPRAAQRRLLPIRVESCSPPGLLASITYIDLFGKDKVEAQRLLKTGVCFGRAKPMAEPVFPGGGAAAKTHRSTQTREPVFPPGRSGVTQAPSNAGSEAASPQTREALRSTARSAEWDPPRSSRSRIKLYAAYVGSLALAGSVAYRSQLQTNDPTEQRAAAPAEIAPAASVEAPRELIARPAFHPAEVTLLSAADAGVNGQSSLPVKKSDASSASRTPDSSMPVVRPAKAPPAKILAPPPSPAPDQQARKARLEEARQMLIRCADYRSDWLRQECSQKQTRVLKARQEEYDLVTSSTAR
jgi:hypothetical protein